jgi:hypothetical protein
MAVQVRWRIDRSKLAVAAVRRAAADGLFESAEFILEDANRTAPIEEGTMIRSGTTSVDRAALRAAISYDVPYAARQHEDLSYRHDPGRRAKWLEATLREDVDRVRQHLAMRIKGALR